MSKIQGQETANIKQIRVLLLLHNTSRSVVRRRKLVINRVVLRAKTVVKLQVGLGYFLHLKELFVRRYRANKCSCSHKHAFMRSLLLTTIKRHLVKQNT